MKEAMMHTRPELVAFVSQFCQAHGYPVTVLGPDLLSVQWNGQQIRYACAPEQATGDAVLVAPGTPTLEGMINECLMNGVGTQAELDMTPVHETAPEAIRTELQLDDDIPIVVQGELPRTLRRFTYRITIGNTFAREEILWSIVLDAADQQMPDFDPTHLRVETVATGSRDREIEGVHAAARREVDRVLTEMTEHFKQAMSEPLRERLKHLNELYNHMEIESGVIQKAEREAAIDREVETHQIHASARLVAFCELSSPLLVCRIGDADTGRDVVFDAVYRHVQMAQCEQCGGEADHGMIIDHRYYCERCLEALTAAAPAEVAATESEAADLATLASGAPAGETSDIAADVVALEDRTLEPADASAGEPGETAAVEACPFVATEPQGTADEAVETIPEEQDAAAENASCVNSRTESVSDEEGTGETGADKISTDEADACKTIPDVTDTGVLAADAGTSGNSEQDEDEPGAGDLSMNATSPDGEAEVGEEGDWCADNLVPNAPSAAPAAPAPASPAPSVLGDPHPAAAVAEYQHLKLIPPDAPAADSTAGRSRWKIPRFMSDQAAPLHVTPARVHALRPHATASCPGCGGAGDSDKRGAAMHTCRTCGCQFCAACLQGGQCPACRNLKPGRIDMLPPEVLAALPSLAECRRCEIGIADNWFVIIGRRRLSTVSGVFDQYGRLLQSSAPTVLQSMTF